MDFNLNDDEIRAIEALRKLEKIWPDSLWVFVGNDISVMRYDSKGKRAVLENDCMNMDYCVETIDGIDCDGGGA